MNKDYALPNSRATAPLVAAERGFIDEVIEPAQTRPKLIRALALLENKRDTNPPKKPVRQNLESLRKARHSIKCALIVQSH